MVHGRDSNPRPLNIETGAGATRQLKEYKNINTKHPIVSQNKIQVNTAQKAFVLLDITVLYP